MKTERNGLLGVALSILVAMACSAQTVLFDFEDGEQGWGSFGAITTDKGAISGSDGAGRFHSGDFSMPDAGNFGIVDISPPGLNLSPYSGISVDARFVDAPGFDPFIGLRQLDIVVATGEDATEVEFFAPKQTMTEEFQTFAIPFSEFKVTGTNQSPTQADLANIRIKLVVFNTNGTGDARLDYDQVIGLPPMFADFDDDGDVDGKDFLAWQRGLGVGTTLAQGDANNSGSVDAADLALWRTQFGTTGLPVVSAVSAVPEAAASMLGMFGLAAVAAYRRRVAK